MSLKKQAINGAIWSYSQQFGAQLISFIVSVLLARIISPGEFGLVGMILIFIAIGTVLFDGGFTSSLIRTKDAGDKDFSTVFFFNLFISIIIYLILFFIAPFIAEFYKQSSLVGIIRIYSLTFIFSAAGAVQNTILTKEMQFKKQAMISLPALIIGSTIGILMAYEGYGVWSLVASAVLNSFFTTVILWFNTKWYPTGFYMKKFREHFLFGYKIAISGVLDVLFTYIYQILIGRFYSSDRVGYYTRANSLMMLPVGNISGALNKVVYPLFSKVQDDQAQFKKAYKQIMMIVLFVVTPIIILMGILATPLVVFLFTDKWLPMVPMFRIICITGILYPVHLYNLLVLQVRGKSNLFLKLEVIKKVILSVIIMISLPLGFFALLWGQAFFSVLILLINTYYAGKEINYNMFAQMKDLLPIFLFAAIMGVITYFVDKMLINQLNIVRLIAGSVIGITAYVGLAWAYRFDSILDIKKMIKKHDTSN